ncbi:sugar phosphate isomerase/epimerase family protein [Halorubrum sp. AS12]|uniref:sugar phosphate isomerase/epimerase family protein n=1 Tax=Halorubrum sp. AS12 TaxID=3409687 RepID=UPI003DA703C7
MTIGLTVGDDLDRLAASSPRFDFCELGIGEPTLVPGDVDPERLSDALAGRELLVHLPYSQRLATYVPEVNDAIVDYQRRLLEAAGDLARETDTPICFDLGHAYMEGGNKAIKRFLRSHGDRISHLHCHDVRRRGDTHLPVGAGEVDYDLVESELAGFDGTVALEVFTDDETLLLDSAERVADRLGASF